MRSSKEFKTCENKVGNLPLSSPQNVPPLWFTERTFSSLKWYKTFPKYSVISVTNCHTLPQWSSPVKLTQSLLRQWWVRIQKYFDIGQYSVIFLHGSFSLTLRIMYIIYFFQHFKQELLLPKLQLITIKCKIGIKVSKNEANLHF